MWVVLEGVLVVECVMEMDVFTLRKHLVQMCLRAFSNQNYLVWLKQFLVRLHTWCGSFGFSFVKTVITLLLTETIEQRPKKRWSRPSSKLILENVIRYQSDTTAKYTRV